MRPPLLSLQRALSQPPPASRSLASIAALPAPPPPTALLLQPSSPSITTTTPLIVLSTSSSRPHSPPRRPPDRRTLNLGKTISTLRSHLPTLLSSPLPTSILSPRITLHLFPRTHPHLPTVSGRVAYNAALWTAPVAWGRVPILSAVQLRVMSERMESRNSEIGHERMVVRWRTEGRQKSGSKEQVFEGIFIFEFDGDGRVGRHVIECVEEGGNGDVGRVVGVVEWVLGRLRQRAPEGELALGCVGEGAERRD